jgi:hypothetical protein
VFKRLKILNCVFIVVLNSFKITDAAVLRCFVFQPVVDNVLGNLSTVEEIEKQKMMKSIQVNSIIDLIRYFIFFTAKLPLIEIFR